jgi:hypothetical protein
MLERAGTAKDPAIAGIRNTTQDGTSYYSESFGSTNLHFSGRENERSATSLKRKGSRIGRSAPKAKPSKHVEY